MTLLTTIKRHLEPSGQKDTWKPGGGKQHEDVTHDKKADSKGNADEKGHKNEKERTAGNGNDSPKKEWPPLEDLIAEYGDSSNTTWTEDKLDIWRHPDNGVPIGYAFSDDYCIIWGNPLCPKDQYGEVSREFVGWVEQQKMKPLWVCVNKEMEQFLAKELGWRAVFCVQEDIVNPQKVEPDRKSEVKRHIRGAEKAGCKVVAVDGVPSKEEQKEIDQVVEEWKKARTGTQVHVTNVVPWEDMEHRRYFYVKDGEGKIVVFLFLAKVARGWAIKDCLQIDAAPKNVTEWLISTAIHSLADTDDDYLSFGPTPAPKLEGVDNVPQKRLKMLASLYGGIESAFLGSKREFRQKFEAEGEPIFVCFPEDGMGKSGADALMKILTS